MKAVLVGVDGSGNAREALRAAIREAQWRDAEVLAVHVVHYPVGFGIETAVVITPEMLMSVGQQELEEEIAAVEAELPDGFPVPIHPMVRLGHTGMELLAAAHGEDVDVVLTVAGTRGLGGFRGLLLGSTTTYLVHHLESPLLVVPNTNENEEQAT